MRVLKLTSEAILNMQDIIIQHLDYYLLEILFNMNPILIFSDGAYSLRLVKALSMRGFHYLWV